MKRTHFCCDFRSVARTLLEALRPQKLTMCKINVPMLVGSLLVSYLLPVARGQTGQVKKLHISLSKAEFVLSEDVMVSLTASNPTNNEITTYSPEGLQINENSIVTFEDGGRREHVGDLAMGGKVISIIRLMPGESRTSGYNLSRLFEIDKPGTYTVQAIRGIQFVKLEKDGKTVWERRGRGVRGFCFCLTIKSLLCEVTYLE